MGGASGFDSNHKSRLSCNPRSTLDLATKVEVLDKIQKGDMFWTNDNVLVFFV